MKNALVTVTTLLSSFAVAVALLGGATHATAQSTASVNIPFAFTANHQHVPAGHYTMQLLSDRYLALVDAKTGQTRTIVMVRPQSGPRIETRGRIVFTTDGTRYFMTEIRLAGSSMHSELVVQPKFKQEELAKAIPPKASTVEVAIK